MRLQLSFLRERVAAAVISSTCIIFIYTKCAAMSEQKLSYFPKYTSISSDGSAQRACLLALITISAEAPQKTRSQSRVHQNHRRTSRCGQMCFRK